MRCRGKGIVACGFQAETGKIKEVNSSKIGIEYFGWEVIPFFHGAGLFLF
jgi:hypothetical protein